MLKVKPVLWFVQKHYGEELYDLKASQRIQKKQVHRFVVDVKQTVCKDRQVWTPQSSVYRFNLHPNVSDICLTVRKTNPL